MGFLGRALVQRRSNAALLWFGYQLALSRMGRSWVGDAQPELARGRSGTLTVFWRAYAWTAIPIIILSIVSTAAAVGEISGFALWLGFYLVYGAAGLWLVATVVKIVLSARGAGGRASGVLGTLAWTAIPSVLLSFVSMAGAAVGVSGSVFWRGFYFVWYGAGGVWLVATVVLYASGARASASGFLKAFSWSAIPMLTLSIVSTAGAEYGVSGDRDTGLASTSSGTWLLAGCWQRPWRWSLFARGANEKAPRESLPRLGSGAWR
jgi:hypothetical protein